jgi:hypothetical protein
MPRRQAMVSAGMLLALTVCINSAGSAAAAGTTGFTCKAVSEGAQFSDAHCLKAAGAGYKHVEVTAGTVTELSLRMTKPAGKQQQVLR